MVAINLMEIKMRKFISWLKDKNENVKNKKQARIHNLIIQILEEFVV